MLYVVAASVVHAFGYRDLFLRNRGLKIPSSLRDFGIVNSAAKSETGVEFATENWSQGEPENISLRDSVLRYLQHMTTPKPAATPYDIL